MSSYSLKTPILFLMFNRPDTSIKVFEKIRQAKPKKLYLAVDGPRKKEDEEKIKKNHEIINKIDWRCEVKTLFREKNLGCKIGVSSGITWFFKNEEKGIILEDDCLPHLDFFAFCENLLDRYSKDERVSVITGNNFQNGIRRGDASYYFSKYNHCWGWASWRRAWKNYKNLISFWPVWKKSSNWLKYIPDKVERKYWENIFNLVHINKIDSWAYPWMASVWFKNGLTITPKVNLVKNIGFNEYATHTTDKNSKFANIPTMELSYIRHSKKVAIDIEADKFCFDNHYGGKYLRFPNNWLIFPYRVFNYIFRKKSKKFSNLAKYLPKFVKRKLIKSIINFIN